MRKPRYESADYKNVSRVERNIPIPPRRNDKYGQLELLKVGKSLTYPAEAYEAAGWLLVLLLTTAISN